MPVESTLLVHVWTRPGRVLQLILMEGLFSSEFCAGTSCLTRHRLLRDWDGALSCERKARTPSPGNLKDGQHGYFKPWPLA